LPGFWASGYRKKDNLWKQISAELDRRKAEREALGASHKGPSLGHPSHRALKYCPVCTEALLGLGNTLCCTEKCAAARRAKTRTKGKRVRKPVEHAPQKC
jgi:hypothetical protein